jgi:MoaA/NifB/PqqE/SkfB family radical SAM enzyme
MKNGELVGRLRAWIEKGERQGPYSLQLSPTMACDLNCIFCRRQDQLREYYKANAEIPNCRYLTMVKDALALGVKVIIVKGGGEPLLRKSLLLELAPMVKKGGAFGNLVTNGTHLDDVMARAFVASGWDQITISLDGPDAETHDYIRAKEGAFDRIMASIDRLNAAKSRAGSKLPLLGFHCVITSRNYDRIDRLIELARAKGAGHVEFDSMSLRDEQARVLLMDSERTERFLDLVPHCLELLERYGMTHNLDRFRRKEYVSRAQDAAPLYKAAEGGAGAASTKLPCYYPFYQAAVTPGGSIVPCCYAEETHRSETNLNDVSFADAWFEGDPKRYRESMKSGEMMPFCKDCTAMYADNNAEIRGWLREEEGDARR